MSLPPDTWFDFGGPLRHLAASQAWLILGACFLAAALAIVLSYRLPGGRLSLGRRVALIGLRLLLFASLLTVLSDPVRHTLTSAAAVTAKDQAQPRRLALLEDRSESMMTPDNRGDTRLANAERVWQRMEPAAQKTFATIDRYNFAGDLTSASGLDSQAPQPLVTGETRLYAALDLLLTLEGPRKPSALVVLTDGLDTTGATPSKVVSTALSLQIPIYTIAGSNRSPPRPFLKVREWQAPGAVPTLTGFTIHAVFEAYSTAERHVDFSLWEGNQKIDGGSLDMGLGSSVIPWTFRIAATGPRTRTFILRFGTAQDSRVAAQSVTVVEDSGRVRVLVVLGAFDWGFRTVTDSLRSDHRFAASALFYDATGYQDDAARSFRYGHLPDSAEGYSDYDCVILYRMAGDTLDLARQKALETFVKTGGNVLFIYPSDAASFAGKPLGYLMPVTLREDPTASFETGIPQPTPMVLTSEGRDSPIFRSATGTSLIPLVASATDASVASPGATVLGLNPSRKDPKSGNQLILLATQTYGKGRSSFFAGDGLWSWKLSEPSSSRAVETFWQQLVWTLGEPRASIPLQFETLSQDLRMGQSVALTLTGSDEAPEITVQSGAEAPRRIEADGTNGTWTVNWTPPHAGDWKVMAVPARGSPAYAFLSVAAAVTGERSLAQTDVTGLRTLASSTGGSLLTDAPPPSWRPVATASVPTAELTRESRQPQWNRWSLLAVILGLFACELILRRRWRLS